MMYEIYPIKIAECDNPAPRILYLGDPAQVYRLYNLMFLVKPKSSNRGAILVDTGFEGELGRQYMPDMVQTPEEEPLRQLDRLGVRPEEVDMVIVTHAHFDHLSPTIDYFINAQIVIQRIEVAAVTAPIHPWFSNFVVPETIHNLIWEWRERVKMVDGEEEVADGIRVFKTGGHTPGNQSVLIKTDAGKVVIPGDIVIVYENIEHDIPVGFNYDLVECFQGMARIRRLADIVLPGHDPQVFSRYGERIG